MPTYRLTGKRTVWFEAEVEADSVEDARELAESHDVDWEAERGRAADEDTIELDSIEEL